MAVYVTLRQHWNVANCWQIKHEQPMSLVYQQVNKRDVFKLHLPMDILDVSCHSAVNSSTFWQEWEKPAGQMLNICSKLQPTTTSRSDAVDSWFLRLTCSSWSNIDIYICWTAISHSSRSSIRDSSRSNLWYGQQYCSSSVMDLSSPASMTPQ